MFSSKFTVGGSSITPKLVQTGILEEVNGPSKGNPPGNIVIKLKVLYEVVKFWEVMRANLLTFLFPVLLRGRFLF